MKYNFLSLSLLGSQLIPFAFGTLLEKLPVIFPVTLTWERGSPDGYERDMIFTNGQFPAPLLSIEEGDNVEVE